MDCGCGSVSTPNSTTPNLQGCRRVWELRIEELGIEELGEFAWLAAADRCQRPTPQLPTSKGAGECGSWELRSWESSHGLRLRIGVNAQLHNSQPPRVPESLGVEN